MRAGGRLLVTAAAACACLGALDQTHNPHVLKGSNACVLEEASVIAFGTYDPTSSASLDTEGRVSYRCGKASLVGDVSQRGVPDLPEPRAKLNVQISFSAGNAGTFIRYMRGGTDQLNYNLYLDALRTQIWGDGTAGTQVYTAQARPNDHVVVVPVFGRVFAGQDVAADFYLDTIIVTLDF
jgi:spore coat protein U-like protein